MKPPIVVDIHKKFGNSYDVYIGRALNYPNATFPKSIWANPYPFKKHGEKSLELYEQHIRKKIGENPEKYDVMSLSGKVLGCWCKQSLPGGICHGDILIKLFQEKLMEPDIIDPYELPGRLTMSRILRCGCGVFYPFTEDAPCAYCCKCNKVPRPVPRDHVFTDAEKAQLQKSRENNEEGRRIMAEQEAELEAELEEEAWLAREGNLEDFDDLDFDDDFEGF